MSQLTQMTPVLYVPAIEPVLPFWQALGLRLTVSVPHADALGFVILEGAGMQLMYQSYASAAEDAPQILEQARSSRSFMYCKVADLDAVIARLGDAPVFLPRRTTFYGADEIGVTDPAGHYFSFAQFLAPQ